MHMRRFITTAALLVTCAAPAWAQGVKLEFHNGRVTLNANNVPLRTILNEWAQQGGTRIVNGDRVPGGPVTLALNDVPERQALDAILRTASGYIAGPRTPGQPGASSYATILILPVSTSPAPVAPPPPQPAAQPQFPFARPVPRTAPARDPDDEPANVLPPGDDDDAAPPRPGAPQRFFNRDGREGGPRPPVRSTTPNDDEAPPPPPATAPTPANPFGVNVGSSQPGVISPVPQPNSQQPRPRPNPEP